MIKEELYVIIGGVRSRLDLAEESGITLEFKSSLFGSLSDIECSHSYSFTLPFTRNNQKVLDMADDIRYPSDALHTKIKCELWQNGIVLFNDGNLYISEILADGYSCVMTWGVVTGLQMLNDNDCNLNELPNQYAGDNNHYAILHDTKPNSSGWGTTSINNKSHFLAPIYPANGYYRPNVMGTKKEWNLVGTPVVPVMHILDLIEQKYGLSINLGRVVTNSNGTGCGYYDRLLSQDEYSAGIRDWGKDFAITFGCIPLSTRNITDAQKELDTLAFNSNVYYNANAFGISNILELPASHTGTTNQFIPMYFNTAKNYNDNAIVASDLSNTQSTGFYPCGIAFAGSVGVRSGTKIGMRLVGKVSTKFIENTPDGASLKVYAWGNNPEAKREKFNDAFQVWELQSIDIEEAGTARTKTYEFNFNDADGYEPITIARNADINGVFLAFSNMPMDYDVNYRVEPVSEDRDTGNGIDVVSNLPEVSVSEFVEFLFRSIGAFPVVGDNGSLTPVYYQEVEDNKTIARDWSKKVIGAVHQRPDKIALAVEGYARNNYYMMSTDDREQSEYDRQKEDDVYWRGVGNITINDAVLEKDADIYTAPFASALEKDNTAPKIPTGNNIKAWKYDIKTRTNTRVDVEPTYGILMYYYDPNFSFTTMKVFMPFAMGNGIGDSASFSFLKRALTNPYIITEQMMLNEMDLKDLDFSVPVYIGKYNSYFAVIKVSRGSDGISEVELLKI